MAAAVSDYTPVKVAKSKIKKNEKPLLIKLKPTVDILKWAGENKKKNQTIVGFALEDKELRKRAEIKLKEKNLDMIVANTLAAIGSEKSTVLIKTPNSDWLKIQNAAKTTIAKKIITLAECI